MDAREAEQRVPRTWFDEEVYVQFRDDPEGPHKYVLLDVVLEGIVVEVTLTHEPQEVGGPAVRVTGHLLIPWGAMRFMQRVVSVTEIDSSTSGAG